MPSPAAVLAIQVDAQTAQANAALQTTQGQLEKTAAVAKTSTDSMATRFTAAGKRMKSVGSAMTKYVTLPAVGIGAAATKMALDFDTSMKLVQTQAGASAKEVDNLSKRILSFAKSGKTQFSPNDLAKALYSVESAGIHGAQAMNTLRQASKLATIGQSDLADTTKALAASQKTGIRGSANLKKAIGTLNATVGSGQMHMEDLVSAMGTGFLSTASQAGVSLSDIGAALDELTKQGQPATQAATRLRMTLSLMAAPSTTAQTALKGIGLNSTDLAKAMQDPKEGLLGALQMLHDHLSSLSKVQQTQVLSQAFGGGKSSAAIIALVNHTGDLKKNLDNIQKGAGGVNKSFHQMNDDPAVRLKRVWSQLQAVLIDLGNKLIPKLIPLVQRIGNIADKMITAFSNLPSWVQDFFLGGIVAGPILKFAGALAGIVGSFKGLTKLGGAGAAAGAARGEGAAVSSLALSANTVLFSAAAGAALGFALTKIFPNGITGKPALTPRQADNVVRFGTPGVTLPSTKSQHASAGPAGTVNAPMLKQMHELFQAAIDDTKKLVSESQVSGSKITDIIDALDKKYGSMAMAASHMSKTQAHTFLSLAVQAKIPKPALSDLALSFAKAGKLSGDDMQQLSKITGLSMKQLRNASDQTTSKIKSDNADQTKSWTAAQKAHGKAILTMIGNITHLARATAKGEKNIGTNTNNSLKALGAKQINFAVKAVGGLFQGGGDIPGHGTGDKVPIMAEPGEFMVNSKAAKKHRALLNHINFNDAPRFAKGGSVKLLPGVNMSQGQEPTILRDLGAFSSETGKTVYVISGYRSPAHSVAVGGFANDPHTKGEAADIGLGSPTLASMMSLGLDSPLRKAGLYRPFYPPSSAEANHVQLLNAAAQGKLGATAQKIARVMLKGPKGPLRSMGQAALDKVHSAANRYLAKQAPKFSVGTGGVPNVPTGPIQQMAHQMITKMWGASQWPPFNSLEMQEAGWNPRAVNPSSGAAGLAQNINPSTYPPGAWPYKGLSSAKLQLDWMLNYIKGRYGNPAGAWGHEQAFNWYGKGGDFIARQPQLIGVGDGGPERVRIGPANDKQPVIHNHIHIDGTDLSEFISFYSNVEYDERDGLSRQVGRMQR